MTRRDWIRFTSAAACAAPLVAQQERRRGGDPKEMLDRQMKDMKKRLKLTDEQEPKVREVLENNMKNMRGLMEKYGRPQPGERPSQEMMDGMRKNREEMTTAMSKVLDEKQMKEYRKMEMERRQQMGGRGPGGPGGPPPQQQ